MVFSEISNDVLAKSPNSLTFFSEASSVVTSRSSGSVSLFGSVGFTAVGYYNSVIQPSNVVVYRIQDTSVLTFAVNYICSMQELGKNRRTVTDLVLIASLLKYQNFLIF